MKKDFELLDHTADIAMRAYGGSLEELFANAAAGMASVMYDPKEVPDEFERPIEAEGNRPDLLLVTFLNEILYTIEVEHFVYRGACVQSVAGGRARGILRGSRIPKGFQFFTEIKAVTYHELALVKKEETFEATVLFDV